RRRQKARHNRECALQITSKVDPSDHLRNTVARQVTLSGHTCQRIVDRSASAVDEEKCGPFEAQYGTVAASVL
ncbi:hypothetical protein, partial [Jannaschia faecimaris]|uniref:hypothetical protein n=1 Tax=Jannaschia faecimaris TaxID=1244108 RepID=UPI001B8B2F95